MILFKNLKYLNLNIPKSNEIARQLPCMIFYAVGAYSGSVALSKLPIPIVLNGLNILQIIEAIKKLINDKRILFWKYTALMMILLSFIGSLLLYGPEKNDILWLMIFLASMSFHSIFTSIRSESNESLMNNEKMMANYLYTVLMLAPCSIIFGDLNEAANFPWLYSYLFLLLCFFSGILGFGSLLTLNLIKENINDWQIIVPAENAICATISLFFFQFQVKESSLLFNFCLVVNYLSAIFAS